MDLSTITLNGTLKARALNSVYARFFPENQPARSTVPVVLYDGFKMEIEAAAIIPS